MRPVTNEPRPRSPNSGNGEPVCGSLETFSAACFFSASVAWLAVAFWSLVDGDAAPVWLLLVAFWSLGDDAAAPGVLLAVPAAD